MIHLYKRVKKEEWHKLERDSKMKYIVSIIDIKNITKIKKAIYNEKRLYIWYKEQSKNMKRIDLEFLNQVVVCQVLNKCNTGFKAIL